MSGNRDRTRVTARPPARLMNGLLLTLTVLLALAPALTASAGVAAENATEICQFIRENLPFSGEFQDELCRDFQSGIARGHIAPRRALSFLTELDRRITPDTLDEAERMLRTVGATISASKRDLPAELLIRRVFELFSRSDSPQEAMRAAAREVEILQQTLVSIARVFRELRIGLAPDVSQKVIETGFGEVKLTVGRVDTVITAAAIALERFERRLNRSLDDFAGMKDAVMQELSTPSFPGAEALPPTLVRYIDAQTTGREWASIVKQIAQDRGRTSES